jgi:threonine dehydratase
MMTKLRTRWQLSGTFKLRGVMNRVLSVPEEKRKQQYFAAMDWGQDELAIALIEAVADLSIEIDC